METNEKPQAFSPLGKASLLLLLLLLITAGYTRSPWGTNRRQQGVQSGYSGFLSAAPSFLLFSCAPARVLDTRFFHRGCACSVVGSSAGRSRFGDVCAQHGSSMGSSPFEGTTSSSSSSELVRKLLEQYCPTPSHVLLRSKVSSTCLGHHPISIG